MIPGLTLQSKVFFSSVLALSKHSASLITVAEGNY